MTTSTIDIKIKLLSRNLKVKDIAAIAGCSSAAVSMFIAGKVKSANIEKVINRLLQEAV